MRHIAIFAVTPAILLALLVASCAPTTTSSPVPAPAPTPAPAPAKTTPALPKGNECVYIWDEGEEISCHTAEIRSGEYSGLGLAIAYLQRGGAYSKRARDNELDDPARAIEDYDRAIEDYDQALRLEKTHRPADWKPTIYSIPHFPNELMI